LSLANIGLAISAISLVVAGVWVGLRWKTHDRRDLVIEASLVGLSFVGAIISRIATAQSDAATATVERQVASLQEQVSSVRSGVDPRHLTPAQDAAIVRDFKGSGATVTIQRCISSESGVTLMNDFLRAFSAAGVTLGPGGVNAMCVTGLLVTYNPSDGPMKSRIEQWLADSKMHASGQTDAGIKSNTFVLLIGSKTESSP
jgi:hypothetical protein